MAVKIRLSRFGKKGKPLYRLVAVDEGKKRDGRFLENLGSYNPHLSQDKLAIKGDRVKYWLSVGAKTTPTAKNLLQKLAL